ncbi:histidine kinase [Saccharopolyspora sp. SCSIO 74807]|uniref:sensor histidine kinase n=1 Tax=Saccharopolyspora sp. SCSIO 74807 TaxID=3118084 RepID=UPI0030D088A1
MPTALPVDRRTWTGRAVQDRVRSLNLFSTLPPLIVVGVFLAFTARSWGHVVLQLVGMAAALVLAERWTADDSRRVARPCLVVTAATWLAGALTDSSAAVYGICVVVSLLIPQLPRRRLATLSGLCVFIAALGSTNLLVFGDDPGGRVFQYVVVPLLTVPVATVFALLNQKFSDLIVEREQSRQREAELAVMRERMRFASDLHDIQGHTLHVVKLKVALAEKLLDRDPGRAREELGEVHALVGDTIAQTKELAHAQRQLNLSAELENAKNLFEAAGIFVHIDREADADPHAGELLGQVLRETTTNILRHAQARQVRITLSASGITIVNDGAHETGPPELSGLSTLRQRLADNGGELEVSRRDGRFRTTATFPARPARKENR